jgi:hypothetical protein
MKRKLLLVLALTVLLMSLLGGMMKTRGIPGKEGLRYVGTAPWRDWVHYHNYTEITDTLAYLNETYPNAVEVFPIGQSWENRTIYCAKLTNESNTHPKPKLFFVGYHHAAEHITAELPLYFVVQATAGFGNHETITRMLNYAEIYVVVALNVDGFEASKNNEWQRKNSRPIDEDGDGQFDEDPPDDENGNGFVEALVRRRTHITIGWEGVDDDDDGRLNDDWIGGVDLNRNYGYAWDKACESGSIDPRSERYKGLGPFSEPETQAIRDLALQHNFKYAVSFHSGDEVIVYPWACLTEPTPDDQLFREIGSDMSASTGANYMQAASYLGASGIWDDWMYANRSVYSFTCEIYINESALKYSSGPTSDTLWQRGFFQYANPDAHDIEAVAGRWLPVFTYLTDRAISESYDVAIAGVTARQVTVRQGCTMQVCVEVANQGSFCETVEITAYANASRIRTQTITLEGGGLTTITFSWNTAGFATGRYVVSAGASSVLGETDTTDNTLVSPVVVFVVMPGDANHDRVINILDAVTIASRWNSKIGDLNYDSSVDWNEDKRIDLLDLILVASRYGLVDP